MCLNLSHLPGLEFDLSIEVGDLRYQNDNSLQIITPQFKDSLITPANAYQYQTFTVAAGHSFIRIPVTISLNAGKTLPQLKGDFISFAIYNGKEEQLNKQSILLKTVIDNTKGDGFYSDTLVFDLSAYAGMTIYLAGSGIMNQFFKEVTLAEIYDLRNIDAYHKNTTVQTLSGTTGSGTETVAATPVKYELFRNYPNPFNPETRIRFALAEAAVVTVAVYDIAGRKIATLAAGHYPAGVHHVVWKGDTVSGQPAASGLYICRFTAGRHVFHQKMVLMR